MVCIYILCFHSSISGHLGCFYFLAVVNNANYEEKYTNTTSNSCFQLFGVFTHFIHFEYNLHSYIISYESVCTERKVSQNITYNYSDVFNCYLIF